MQYQKNQIAQTNNDGADFMAMKKNNAVYENPNALFSTQQEVVQKVKSNLPFFISPLTAPIGLYKIIFGKKKK
jgi:hypothetical protein